MLGDFLAYDYGLEVQLFMNLNNVHILKLILSCAHVNVHLIILILHVYAHLIIHGQKLLHLLHVP